MISEDRLRQAVRDAGALLDQSLPDPDQCHHTFSPAFLNRMEALLRRRKRAPVYRVLKGVACFFLAFLLGGTIFLSTNAQAREAFFGWVREQAEGAQRYFHQGDVTSSSDIVHYQIDVPDGYWLEDTLYSDALVDEYYMNKDGLLIGFSYQYEIENSVSEIYIDDTDATTIQTEVHGNSADLYIAHDPEGSNTVIWMDKETGALLEVTAFLPQDELMALAESVTPIKK